MKKLSPYWFMSDPVDVEHKYYVLMDFLQSVEAELNTQKYGEPIQKLTRIYADLKSFKKTCKLSDKTIKNLSQDEMIKLDILSQQLSNNEEIEAIIEDSIDVINIFFKKIAPYIKEVEKSLDFKIVNEDALRKDKGYITMRNNKDKKMKIYSWQFSVIKIGEDDQIGLLLSELLDPLPDYTKSNEDLYNFFQKEIKNFSRLNDCFIVVDLSHNKGEDVISFDLMKEKSIEFIVDSYKKYLSEF